MRAPFLVVVCGFLMSLGGCGGGDSAAPTSTVGELKEGATRALAANGAFKLPPTGKAPYGLTIATPAGNAPQKCVAAHASGAAGDSNSTDITVACTTNAYEVGGTVNGLSGSGLVLQNNSGGDLPVTVNGRFDFAAGVVSGSYYSVTIKSQPVSPSQTCTVANPSGKVTNSDVDSVAIMCTTDSFSIGGTVTGLAGTGLRLTLDGSNDLSIGSNGTFTFPGKWLSGARYSVSVKAQPSGISQTCAVMNSTGIVGAAEVTNVSVSCATNAYMVGGTATGLTGAGLVLALNGSQSLAVDANGAFTFPAALSSGHSYVVTVQSQPSVAREICSISGGSGSVGSEAVGNVAVACSIMLGFMYELDPPKNQIYSYAIEAKTGNVIPLTAPTGSQGANPTSILASTDGRHLYVTNQSATAPPTPGNFVGNIATFAVNADTGQLTPEGTPVATTPIGEPSVAGRFLFIFNAIIGALPEINTPPPTLMEYVLDPSTGLPTPIGTALSLPSENQLFAMAVSPDQQFLYVLTGDPEADDPVWPTITVYAIDPNSGTLTAGQSMTVDVNSNSIAIDPQGRFLYLETARPSNPAGPASATLLPYAIDPVMGSLSAIGSGTQVATNGGPVVIDPSGNYLYAENSLNAGPLGDTIQALVINQNTGVLSTMGPLMETDGQPIFAGGLMFDPSGEFLYLVSTSEANGQATGTALATFTVSAASGSAGQLAPSGNPQQLPVGLGGWSIAIVE